MMLRTLALLLTSTLLLAACGDDTSGSSASNGGSTSEGGSSSSDGGSGPSSGGGEAPGEGGGTASDGVRIELIDRQYFVSGDGTETPSLSLTIRVTNVSVEEPIGAGWSRFSLVDSGVARQARPSQIGVACDEAVTLVVGGSIECAVDFTVDAFDGRDGTLMFSDPASGAATDVVLPDREASGAFAVCELLTENLVSSECQECINAGCEAARYTMFTECLCGGQECCAEMDFSCAVGAEVAACVAACPCP